MIDTTMSASEYAKYKLIMAAIRLFGEAGVNSVSLREINRVAGAKNNSALHYHYGDKMGLVSAAIDFIQEGFNKERGSGLDDLKEKAKKQPVTVDEIMQVFIAAYVTVIEKNDWGYNAVRAIARMEFDGDAKVHEVLNKSAGPAVRRMFVLLNLALPDIPPKLLKQRINFSVNAVIQGFADHKNLHQCYLGNLAVKDLSQLASIYQSMTVAMLSAPNPDAVKKISK